MKRSRLVPILPLVFAILSWSQTSTPPPKHSDHSQSHAQHEENKESTCRHMMDEHMREISATAQALTTNLAQLKATLPLISDINERSRWQSNIAMWQALADHFAHMAQHAEHMQSMGMGCGMMMGHSMGDTPATPPPAAKPQ